MGYSLAIGEAVIEGDDDYIHIWCEPAEHFSAPAFGEATDFKNERWPSYSVWANAMRELDLMDWMFDTRNSGAGHFTYEGVERYPLIQEHPGAAPITKEHLAYLEQKVAAYKEKHPDHIAKFAPPKEGAKPLFGTVYRDEDLNTDPKYDGNLCRAEWLLYWIRWALENCKRPVFVNS